MIDPNKPDYKDTPAGFHYGSRRRGCHHNSGHSNIPCCLGWIYFEPLIDFGARFIIVDDSEGKVRVDHPQFTVFTWQDQARMLGKDVIAIPRRNGACRDFGFFIAWRESADGEIVIALDDDCKVEEPDFGQSVPAMC